MEGMLTQMAAGCGARQNFSRNEAKWRWRAVGCAELCTGFGRARGAGKDCGTKPIRGPGWVGAVGWWQGLEECIPSSMESWPGGGVWNRRWEVVEAEGD